MSCCYLSVKIKRRGRRLDRLSDFAHTLPHACCRLPCTMRVWYSNAYRRPPYYTETWNTCFLPPHHSFFPSSRYRLTWTPSVHMPDQVCWVTSMPRLPSLTLDLLRPECYALPPRSTLWAYCPFLRFFSHRRPVSLLSGAVWS